MAGASLCLRASRPLPSPPPLWVRCWHINMPGQTHRVGRWAITRADSCLCEFWQPVGYHIISRNNLLTAYINIQFEAAIAAAPAAPLPPPEHACDICRRLMGINQISKKTPKSFMNWQLRQRQHGEAFRYHTPPKKQKKKNTWESLNCFNCSKCFICGLSSTAAAVVTFGLLTCFVDREEGLGWKGGLVLKGEAGNELGEWRRLTWHWHLYNFN